MFSAQAQNPFVHRRSELLGSLLLLVAGLPMLAFLLALPGCTKAPGASGLAVVRLPARGGAALNGTGPTATGTATFDALSVDANTWQGSPAGTGTFQVPLSPALSGGPSVVAATQSGQGTTWSYVVIGDFTQGQGNGLVIASDQPFAVGTSQIGAHTYVAVFDVTTGNAVATAATGTLTLTAADVTPGQRVTGTLSADFQSASNTGCTSNSQCAANEVCQNGVCVPNSSGCTSNSQCAAGEVCQNGTCVRSGGCTSNSQCAANEVCQNGVCVPNSTGCTSNSQCQPGEVCVSGVCEPGQTGGCTQQRGTGSFTVSEGSLATCSAVTATSANVAQAQVMIGSLGTAGAGPAILLLDPSNQQTGLALQLSACPAQAGTLAIGSGVDAYFFGPGVAASPTIQVYAQYQATGGSVTFSQVGATLQGTASLTFDNGGTGSASFSLQ